MYRTDKRGIFKKSFESLMILLLFPVTKSTKVFSSTHFVGSSLGLGGGSLSSLDGIQSLSHLSKKLPAWADSVLVETGGLRRLSWGSRVPFCFRLTPAGS